MVLSDRFAGTTASPSLFRRTLLYIVGFGLGSLAVAGLLSLVFVSVANSILPGASDAPTLDGPTASAGSDADSKARPPRANEGPAKGGR